MMVEPVAEEAAEEKVECLDDDDNHRLKMEGLMMENLGRKEKRKALKKMKRKQIRKEVAMMELEEEEASMNDPEELKKLKLMELEEERRMEMERKLFEEQERAWIEAMELKKKKMIEEEEEEQQRRMALEEESMKLQNENGNECKDDGEWEYVEEGPAEIIWQGNEIIVKKKKIRVPKKDMEQYSRREESDRPTSNPLPPESEAFAGYRKTSMVSAQEMMESVAQQVPNFGTEQDKDHCPFHLKTGACRFGQHCSRVHFYPDKACTLLIKNVYNGPGLAWEQDEGLEFFGQYTFVELFSYTTVASKDLGLQKDAIEVCSCLGHPSLVNMLKSKSNLNAIADHTDEEVEHSYEEFYEDVHTEFLKFGEIINFKVCKNGSSHLRGNVYVHYKSLDSSVLACHSINGRFFAGKQISCEFVNVTRWKVAICGEYMKSRFKTCSRGTACNFIHCFHNPGGDYEWADSDRPPPRYWVTEMVSLFGHSDESRNDREREQEYLDELGRSGRYRLKRSRSTDVDYSNDIGSSGRHNSENEYQKSRHYRHRHRGRDSQKKSDKNFDEEAYEEENSNLKESLQRKKRSYYTDSDEETYDLQKRSSSRHQRNGNRHDRSHEIHKSIESQPDCSRRNSRHGSKAGYSPDDHSDRRSRDPESDGEWLDRDGRKNRRKASNLTDGREDRREGRTRDNESRRNSRHLKHKYDTDSNSQGVPTTCNISSRWEPERSDEFGGSSETESYDSRR